MQLKLLHKGLLLVSIPLCFEITIFSILINLQNQAEVEARRISTNKKINDSVNGILHDILKIGKVQTTYSLAHFNTATFRKNLDDVFKRFDELDTLTLADPSINHDVQVCRAALVTARKDLIHTKKLLQEATSDELPEIILRSRKELDHDLDEAFSGGILDLAEKSYQGTNDVRSRKLREKVTIVLKYALGASVLMGIFGAVMFSRHLVGRLQLLGKNANRLAKGQALAAIEGGTDEVADLEKSFHYAADLIAQATKMRQEVTAMITNDLKIPLEYIKRFLDRLTSGELGSVDEQGKMLLSLSQKESVRMVGLIERVLDLEKIRSGNLKIKLAPIDVKAMLAKSVDSVQLLADEKSIALKRDFERAPDSIIHGDTFWLGQVVVNVLSNAIKFSPTKTTVTATIEISAREVVIRISDMGPGISKEDRKLVFERFHRISANSNGIAGSGLGLTISRELIELHQGSIDIDSELGAGSTFNIRLPRIKQVAQKSSSGARDGKNLVG
jgi:signal transduction histidine kinase